MLLISIIIPIYNVEAYLERCFDSIRRQISNNFEVICIDDGSKDKSGEICNKYAKIDSRFKVFHKNNGGVSSARNFGMKMASGKYLAWIDPDDYISDSWYTELEEYLLQDIDFIFFDYILLKNNKKIVKKFAETSKKVEKFILLDEITLEENIQNQLWRTIYKKNLMKDIIFPENICLMEDYAVLHKIIYNADKIFYLSANLYYYIIRDNSITMIRDIVKDRNGYLIAKERYIFLKKYNITVTKIGYLKKAITFLVKYCELDKNLKMKYRNDYLDARKDIRHNILYILKNKDVKFMFKLKELICFFYLEKIIYKIYTILK
ncbi:MAG: glycosyltransferase family 2 protein [Megamonas funiformis]|jgi:glycosyltransferase involved in cell wall biosynthesis|uniref:glycosyltransferase family 2 protein n=1 Tax=Megamonas funiformis TaxID=437897 RepID=UPI001ED703AB|nr:glycosyltransferase family 2 protein [Megamonas funiformis]MBS7212308.1 glycosyltransferase family 2 protein [Megamonas funiformis]